MSAPTSSPARYHLTRVCTAKLWRLCRILHNRHTMAVNNLRSWFARGEDAGALLPVLQAYMGHASIAGTDYYLRLTAESYPHIIARVQRAFGDVVPPLKAGQCDGD